MKLSAYPLVRTSLVSCVAAIIVAACDGGVRQTGSSDTGSGGGPTGVGGAFDPFVFSRGRACVRPESSELPACSERLPPSEPLVVAADIVEGGRFRSLDGDTALVEGTASGLERYRVVQVRKPVGADEVQPESPVVVRTLRWDGASGEITVVGVSGGEGYSLPLAGNPTVAVVAVACDAAGCTLLGAGSEETELVPLDGGSLPTDLMPVGVAVTYRSVLCVYGSGGLLCNDGGGWADVLGASPSPSIRWLQLFAGFGLALSDAGELWVWRDTMWEQEDAGLPSPIVSVTVSALGIVAIGSGGELAIDYGGSEASWLWLCTDPEPALYATVGASTEPSLYMAVTSDGTVANFDRSAGDRNPPWCRRGELGPEPFVGTGFVPCHDALNSLIATEAALFVVETRLACYVR